MYNLLKFITKYHFTILFVLIQIFNLALITQFNQYQKSNFLYFYGNIVGKILHTHNSFVSYLSLKEENEKLAQENSALKNEKLNVYYTEVPALLNDTIFYSDTILRDTCQQFLYYSAKVISNSVNKLNNLLYINKGSLDGIKEGMGVVSMEGVVGVVKQTSKNYSTVMPVINRSVNISAKLKGTGYFGNLSWDGNKPNIAQLNDIPNHIFPQKGDTVVTSGYSHIFPEGEIIGTVSDFKEISGAGFLFITVKLSTDFSKLNFVYVINNNDLEELNSLLDE